MIRGHVGWLIRDWEMRLIGQMIRSHMSSSLEVVLLLVNIRFEDTGH